MHKHLRHSLYLNLLLASSLLSEPSLAGGPLVIEGANGHTPLTYADPSNITLHLETGKLGSRTNAQADALMQQAIDLWNAVPTSNINLSIDDSSINVDINGNNFSDYLPNVSGTVFHGNDGLNPVAYDDDGSIIDAFFGMGQSNNTIGFAASIYTVGGNHFLEGYAVINGNGKSQLLSNLELKLLIAHEIGHFFGLDHSQIDISNQESGTQFCQSASRAEYAVMYPFACRDVDSLHADDISALSALYPDQVQVDASYGKLEGRLLDQSGKAIPGANIWATGNTGQVISTVSDYKKQGTGFYQMLLPPGNYTLHANSVNTEFFGGSSVGPYAFDSNDLSFTCASGIAPITYEGSTPGNAEVISISSGQTTQIDFSLTGIDIGNCVIPSATPTAPASNKQSKGAFSITGLLLISLALALSTLCRRRSRS